MTEHEAGSITGLLFRLRNGDQSVRNEIICRLERQILPVAQSLTGDSLEGTLNQSNQIVREALDELLTGEHLNNIPNRVDLVSAATRVIRQKIVGRARSFSARISDPDRTPLPITEINRLEDQPTVIGLVELNDAIESLCAVHQRASEVITLRYLAGYSVEQTATALGVPADVVEMDWRFARAWILRYFRRVSDPGSNSQDG